MLLAATSTAHANSIGIAQCETALPCNLSSSPTPFSMGIDAYNLNFIRSTGNDVFIHADQWSAGIMRVGAITITFTSGAGGGGGPPPVTEVFNEFSGGFVAGPCQFVVPSPCGTSILGLVHIPTDATAALITGTFGNSAFPNTAAMHLHLFSFGPMNYPVPGPIAGAGLPGLMMLLALWLKWRRT